MAETDYRWLPIWLPRAQALEGRDYCCPAHQRDVGDTIWAHTGEQLQDMVLGDTIRSFTVFVFWTGFHYLMTYGLDGIDTQYS